MSIEKFNNLNTWKDLDSFTTQKLKQTPLKTEGELRGHFFEINGEKITLDNLLDKMNFLTITPDAKILAAKIISCIAEKADPKITNLVKDFFASKLDKIAAKVKELEKEESERFKKFNEELRNFITTYKKPLETYLKETSFFGKTKNLIKEIQKKDKQLAELWKKAKTEKDLQKIEKLQNEIKNLKNDPQFQKLLKASTEFKEIIAIYSAYKNTEQYKKIKDLMSQAKLEPLEGYVQETFDVAILRESLKAQETQKKRESGEGYRSEKWLTGFDSYMAEGNLKKLISIYDRHEGAKNEEYKTMQKQVHKQVEEMLEEFSKFSKDVKQDDKFLNALNALNHLKDCSAPGVIPTLKRMNTEEYF